MLDRNRGKRKFRRITGAALTDLLPRRTTATPPAEPAPADTPPHDADRPTERVTPSGQPAGDLPADDAAPRSAAAARGAGPPSTARSPRRNVDPWHGQCSCVPAGFTVQPSWVQIALKQTAAVGRVRVDDRHGLAVGKRPDTASPTGMSASVASGHRRPPAADEAADAGRGSAADPGRDGGASGRDAGRAVRRPRGGGGQRRLPSRHGRTVRRARADDR